MGIVINTSYKAPSYEELVTPIAQMTQTQRSLEDLYATLGDKVQTWNNKLDPNLDQASIDILNKYTQGLSASADNLMNNGFNQSTYKDIAKLRSLYNSQIAPIQEKYNFRAEQAKQQQLLTLNNPAILFNTDYSKTPLDQIRVGDYGQAYNAAPIIKMVGDNLTKYASSIYNKGQWRSDELFQGTLAERTDFQGFTSELLKQALAHPESKYGQDIQKIMQQGVDASGIKDWNGNNAQNAKEKLINLLSAQEWNLLGTPKVISQENKAAIEALNYKYDSLLEQQKFQNQLALAEAKARAKAQQKTDELVNGTSLDNPVQTKLTQQQKTNRDIITKELQKGKNGKYYGAFKADKYGEFLNENEIAQYQSDWLAYHPYIKKKYETWKQQYASSLKNDNEATKYHKFDVYMYKIKDPDTRTIHSMDSISKQAEFLDDLKKTGVDQVVDSIYGYNQLLQKGDRYTEEIKALPMNDTKKASIINALSTNSIIYEYKDPTLNSKGGFSLGEGNNKALNDKKGERTKLLDYIKKNPHLVTTYIGTGANADKIILDVKYSDGNKRYIFKNNARGINNSYNTEDTYGIWHYHLELLKRKVLDGTATKAEKEKYQEAINGETRIMSDTADIISKYDTTEEKSNNDDNNNSEE